MSVTANACRLSLPCLILTLTVALAAGASQAQPVGVARPFGGPVLQLARQTATIYPASGFGGAPQELAIGDHRVGGASSIRVAPGLVAILYQFADDVGGYGVSIDVMEDQADLAALGLDRVAYVSVFAATKDKYVWVRGSAQTGSYVPGHWERARANGSTSNTAVAVASPPLPSRGHTVATAISNEGPVWTITHLGDQSHSDEAQWAHAQQQLGVIGSDYRGPQRIGDAAVERASNNIAIPDSINFWYPNPPSLPESDHRGRFKRTLVGNVLDKITKNWSNTITVQDPITRQWKQQTFSGEYELSAAPSIANIPGTFRDFDLNVDILPYADYQYLIKESHRPERSTLTWVKNKAASLGITDYDHNPCTDPFIGLEAEIDSSDSAKNKLLNALRSRIGKPVAVYGPWIYDIGHCHHPEIHPAEEIWWTDTAFTDYAGTVNRYNLNVIADASGRFLWRHQMDGDNKMRPWAAPPITGTFAVAFEVPLGETAARRAGKRFTVQDVDFYNVKVLPEIGKSFDLRYQGQTLVSFVPTSPIFTVSYEGVGLKPGSPDIVRGFLVIDVTVGSVRQKKSGKIVLPPSTVINVPDGADPDAVPELVEPLVFEKTPGHYLFRLIETSFTNTPTAAVQ